MLLLWPIAAAIIAGFLRKHCKENTHMTSRQLKSCVYAEGPGITETAALWHLNLRLEGAWETVLGWCPRTSDDRHWWGKANGHTLNWPLNYNSCCWSDHCYAALNDIMHSVLDQSPSYIAAYRLCSMRCVVFEGFKVKMKLADHVIYVMCIIPHFQSAQNGHGCGHRWGSLFCGAWVSKIASLSSQAGVSVWPQSKHTTPQHLVLFNYRFSHSRLRSKMGTKWEVWMCSVRVLHFYSPVQVKYTGTAVASDQNGKEIFCIKMDFDLS